jgi:hypothetical protein
MIRRHVIETVPALDDWYAVFAEDGKPREYPIALWALVEDHDGYRCMTGVLVDARGDIDASEEPGFLGYLEPGQFVDDVYAEAATEYQKRILSNRRRDSRLLEQQGKSEKQGIESTGGLR